MVVCCAVGGQDSGAAGGNSSCSSGTERGSAANQRPQAATEHPQRLSGLSSGERKRERERERAEGYFCYLYCQEEVRKYRQLLQEKEQQLMKMMTSLHVAAAQVRSLSLSLSVSHFPLVCHRLPVCVVMEMRHPQWLSRRGWGLVTAVSW